MTTHSQELAEHIARKAFDYARDLPGSGLVVLYGASLGAAAVLKSVADDKVEPAALILECPFESLVGTVRHRFTSWGIPSFPLADLLVFWDASQFAYPRRMTRAEVLS